MTIVDKLSSLFNGSTVMLIAIATLTSNPAHALGDLTLDGVTKDYVDNTGETTLLNSDIKTVRVIGELRMNNTHSGYVHEVGKLIGSNSSITSLDATGDVHLRKSKLNLIDTATMVLDLDATKVATDVIINRKWDSFFKTTNMTPTHVRLNASRIEGTLNCVTPCVIEKTNSYIGELEGKTNLQSSG